MGCGRKFIDASHCRLQHSDHRLFEIHRRLTLQIAGFRSLCVCSHFAQSFEAAPDQFADAVGSTFQLIGDRLVAEADDPQVDGVLLAWRKFCQVALYRLLQFLVEIDFLGIKVRAGMSRQQQLEIGL